MMEKTLWQQLTRPSHKTIMTPFVIGFGYMAIKFIEAGHPMNYSEANVDESGE